MLSIDLESLGRIDPSVAHPPAQYVVAAAGAPTAGRRRHPRGTCVGRAAGCWPHASQVNMMVPTTAWPGMDSAFPHLGQVRRGMTQPRGL